MINAYGVQERSMLGACRSTLAACQTIDTGRGRMINAYGVQERSTLSAWHHDHRQGHGRPVNAHSRLPPLMA
jgi:hypothetical protein